MVNGCYCDILVCDESSIVFVLDLKCVYLLLHEIVSVVLVFVKTVEGKIFVQAADIHDVVLSVNVFNLNCVCTWVD